MRSGAPSLLARYAIRFTRNGGGTHPHFHQPTDKADTINPEILQAVAYYVLALIWQLATATRHARLRLRSRLGQEADRSAESGGKRPILTGSIPSSASIKLSSVTVPRSLNGRRVEFHSAVCISMAIAKDEIAHHRSTASRLEETGDGSRSACESCGRGPGRRDGNRRAAPVAYTDNEASASVILWRAMAKFALVLFSTT
jgi:hypothetical protein